MRALALSCLLFSVASPVAAQSTERADPMRVLFIGNSYTRFNDLTTMVADVSESVEGGPIVRAERDTRAGYDLMLHWRRGRDTRSRIARGEFDAIVIQGHSLAAINEPHRLSDYAHRFAEEARTGGARIVLFETWARHAASPYYRSDANDMRDPAHMTGRIGAVYQEIATDIRATVAPVGHAWLLASSEVPGAALHRSDGMHPDVTGTYLAALVLYGTLTGRDPRTVTWAPWRMDRREAARIRTVAAVTIAERAAHDN
jgi:hypothetical protein